MPVATPEETIWQIEPHTAAKHTILRKYLDAWFPILSKQNSRLIYLDGFAGPGRYTGGEPGSPIVALESALTHRSKLTAELVFLFIEQRNDRADYLDAEISKLRCPSRFKIGLERGSFAEKTGAILDNLDGEGRRLAPTFALIDPFGFSGIPYSLITRLLAKERCEVLITFMVGWINRFLEHPNDAIRTHIIETFGTEEAIDVPGAEGERVTALKNLYQKQLKKTAKFVRYFELRNRNDCVVYYLFFATNHSLGHLRMKEAMWGVDPLGEFSFSDATNPAQTILFLNSPLEILKSDLIRKFSPAGEITIGRVETYVFDETAFVRKHMGEVLRNLESENRVRIATKKTDGKRRLANTYPNRALITFV